MKKIIFTLAALMLLVAGVNAQNYTGLLANLDGLTVGDMVNISQSQFQYGTARNMAMGGALSSLGADVSVMATNPAGLGMYSKSEITITPMVTSQRSDHNATNYMDNSKTSFSMSNVAIVATIPTNYSSKGLLSFSIGFAYNKTADLNYNTSFYSTSSGRSSSIGQFFSNQLSDGGISLSQVEGSNNPTWNDITTDSWGAVLGYKVGLADYDDTEGWYPGWISEDAEVGHYVTMESIGSVGEYDISMGANISNKLYIGATLGITSLNQKINYNYSEDYSAQDGTSDYELNYAHYNQTVTLNGTGVNFKMGVIYRPTTQLRVSFAVHTPTAYAIDREYQAAASSSVKVNTTTPDSGITTDSSGNAYFEETSPLLYDYDSEGWYFNTPTRIIAGASYMLGNRALLSVDYQRDWYNNMRMTSAPYGINIYDYENQAETYLKATNTLRLGGEFRVTPNISLRAGYGFSSCVTTSGDIAYTPISPTVESTNYYSAGVGFAVSANCSIDFAYMRHTTHYTDFQLFGVSGAEIYSLDIVRNNFAMTTSIRW